MTQLILKFPFKKKYYEQDFYVSSNNFEAYKLIENWPNWPSKWINVYGVSGSGKTHLSKILEKKIERIIITKAKKINDKTIINLENFDCLIIDDYSNNIDQKILYSLFNQSKQLDNYILINSNYPINEIKFEFEDLKSRIRSFVLQE